MRRLSAPCLVLALLAVTGCAPAGVTLPPGARLPADATLDLTDPTRRAILQSADALAHPAALRGEPGRAAILVAQLDYLAVAVPGDGGLQGAFPMTGDLLRGGRDEARAALGLAPGLPPQVVIDSLYAAARALSGGDTAAAERALVPVVLDPAAALGRLAALPPLPRAAFATSVAATEVAGPAPVGSE